MNVLPDPRWAAALAHSHYLQRLFAARPELPERLAACWQTPFDADALASELQPQAADAAALHRQLRHLRQLAMAWLELRDLCGLAPLAEVMESMTLLADLTLNVALDFHHRELVATFGEPLDAKGRPQRLIVLGMGKLGGRELNVSSDVDYIFLYPEDGETAGPKKIDNFDFFNRLGKRLIAAQGEITADGQVFRVDMRLRPNGDSGPLVGSLAALETYFITQGREWERYAWIKARPMNAGANLAGDMPEWIATLARTARPFVFRKYLDYGAINAMRDLHAQIRREVARKDMADNIKLGPGGIREIEFIAQVFQLIRGGRDPDLQIRPTLVALARLAERELLPPDSVRELSLAYDFLRRLEHRLQYVDDRQIQNLPETPEEQRKIAVSMGFGEDWDALLAALNAHRKLVSGHFEAVFSDPQEGEHPLTALWHDALAPEERQTRLAALGFCEPEASAERLATFLQSGRYRQLPASNRERMDAVGPRLIELAAATPEPDRALERGLALLETVARRGAYLALLQQYPPVLAKVVDMIAASAWAADYLNRHPLLLDELLDARLFHAATDWSGFRSDLQRQLELAAGDAEREMDILREQHHAQVFRLLAQDLAGLHTVERISDHLTELADIMVGATLNLCWRKLAQRHRERPAFAVIGYGKLGGKELGYSSDLDLVFLADEADDDPAAQANYTRLGQRISTWLSSRTPAGQIFETDLRLRPNGDAGVLAPTLAAFREYEQNHAWIWEHQALTRARFVAGDPELGQRFEAIRREILCAPRDPERLCEEVLAMRQKMLDNHKQRDPARFDLKQDRGGLIDVEFIVQYLILKHAHDHPQLTANLGNIALLNRIAELGLIPTELARAVGDSYRDYRRLQHACRLNGLRPAPPRAEWRQKIAEVEQLWELVFG